MNIDNSNNSQDSLAFNKPSLKPKAVINHIIIGLNA
jgi:hypothetical protein